ncbi:MAG: carboxylesterase/lipase family protein [Mycobacteriaceae bacterium]
MTDGVVAYPGSGAVRGKRVTGINLWQGIPYAAAPIEGRRFCAPEPLPSWSGERLAVKPGLLPPQGKSILGTGIDDPKEQGEDCLTLSIWSPDISQKLPVMVWIPGGAFVFGAGQLKYYDGTALARNGNVVVVNITYRLGALGGLELSDLGEGFDSNLPIRDQIAALQWIQKNISAFGGDPEQVTIFGESAGGTSIIALLSSPLAQGLFSRAIAQSPSLSLFADKECRARRARRFLELVDETPSGLKTKEVSALRRAARLLDRECVAETPGFGAFGLTIGDEVLPLHPIAAAKAGEINAVPLIIGTNKDEATLFSRAKPPALPTTRATADRMFKQIAPQAQARVWASYQGLSKRQAEIAVGTDAIFNSGVWDFIDYYSDKASTYLYRYDFASPVLKAVKIGATHASEIVHVHHTYRSQMGMAVSFPTIGIPALGKRMQSAWLAFASGNDPGWQRFTTADRCTKIWDRRDSVSQDPDRLRRQAWSGVGWYS